MKRIAGRSLFGAFILSIWLSAVSVSQDVPSVPARKVQAELPVDITGPDQRVPRALGQASFFPCKNVPKGTESDLFMVPSGIGEFFALWDKDGNPVGVFSSDKPGTFTCVVVAVIDGKLAKDTHTIQVGGAPPPGPGPGPDPPPPGPTPVPEGALGFTKMAFQEASTVNAASRSKAVELADNFEGVASSIAAGAIRTAEEGNAAVTAGNRRVLSDAVHKGAWTPFFMAWAMHADAAMTAGTLKATAEAYAEIYRATADGLRRVK